MAADRQDEADRLDAYYLSEQDPKDPPKTVPNGPVEPRTLELEGPDGHAQEADITLSNLTLSEVPFPAQAQTGHEMERPRQSGAMTGSRIFVTNGPLT